jgi:uncharacterized GH25 family protein
VLVALKGAGAELETSERTEADGRVELEIPLASESDSLAVVYDAEGYVPGMLTAVMRPGETVNTGTTVLVSAVLVSGHVVDRGGNPVDDARVFLREPELPEGAPEGQLRRRGPDGLFGEDYSELLEVPADRGAFQVRGEAEAVVRLWARAPGMRYGWTEPIELSTGRTIDGVEIVLAEMESEDRIAGVVLDADGEPLPQWSIRYRFGDEGLSVSSSLTTDEDGRFELVVIRRATHHFDVQGDDEHPGTASSGAVEPGTLDLVLELTEEGALELAVTDPNGNPVRTFELHTRTFFTANSSSSMPSMHETEDGRVRITPPDADFELEVAAQGFMRRTLGRFGEATGVPTHLECVLEPTPGVRGRVTVDGSPVAGARVRLHRALEADTRLELNSFPCRIRPHAESTAVTDEDGRFSLDVSDDGDYVVRAEPDGRAPVESEPILVVAARGHAGVELEASAGGSLVVRATAPSGRDVSGIVVGITDGGPSPRTARTDDSGEVRFEGLRPGPWIVLERDEEIERGSSSSVSWTDEEPYELPWSCDVRAGRTTVYELVLED